MCVVIIKDNKKVIDSATLLASSVINPDGLGILWLDSYEIEKVPSKEYEKLLTKRPFIAHFRYATVGKVNLNNCHPFSITDKSVLFQNGTVQGLGNLVKTDTQHLAEILKTMPPKHWGSILEITDCRYVIANTKSKKYKVFNQKMWHTDEQGILYSKKNVLGLSLMAVYGTLKYRGSNYYNYLVHSEYVGGGYTKDKYPLIIEGLPYLLSKKGKGHNVDVDVFLVDKETLVEVDALESHPQWYKREIIPIELDSGETVDAWIYFNDQADDKGEYHKSYEAEPSWGGYSGGWYDDYDKEDSGNPYGVIETKDKCPKCKDNLVYDEFDMAHYCFNCDDYVDNPEIANYNWIETSLTDMKKEISLKQQEKNNEEK